MNLNNWERVDKDEKYLKVYVHKKSGNIRVVYPRAPKWAQRAALKIYRDLEYGLPTQKGVKDIVLGLWAKMIAREKKNGSK